MINTKIKSRMLINFLNLNNNGDLKPSTFNNSNVPFEVYENINNNLSEEAIINILLCYIQMSENEKAIELTDYIIENGFVFYDRKILLEESGMSENLVYKTPSILFKFAAICQRIYEITGEIKYLTESNNIISNLLKDDVVLDDVYSSAIPTAIIPYENNLPLSEGRFGTYTYDVNPLIWFLLGYENNEQESIDFIIESSDKFKEQFSTGYLFLPYYLRNIPENSELGEIGTWVTSGYLGNENDFIHQYKTLYNLSEYYYLKYKKNNYRNNYVKDLIRKFTDYINSAVLFPSTFVNEFIYASSSNIFANDNTVNASTLYKTGFTWDKKDLSHYAYFGKSMILNFLVDRDEFYLSLATKMVENILNYQQVNGSFKTEDYTYLKDQGIILEFLNMYENLNLKSYYDIINDAMKMMNLEPIDDSNVANHMQHEVIGICKDSINEIWGNDEYIGVINFNNIPSFIEPRWYPVLKYHIAWQLALTREHELTDWFESKYMEAYSTMKLRLEIDLSEENQMPSNVDWGIYG